MSSELRYDDKGNILLKGETQKKDGRYCFSTINPVTKKRMYIYDESLSKLRKKENEMHNFTLREIFGDIGNENATLNSYFDVYLDAANLSPACEMNYRRMWDSQIRDVIGDMRIVDITEGVIHLLFMQLSKDGYMRNTIKYLKTILTNSLEIAFTEGVIRFNPAKRLRISRYGKDKYEAEPLSQKQEERVLKFIRRSKKYARYEDIILIMLLTGLRPGELIALTWCDIDLVDNKLYINKQLVYRNYGDGCKFHLREPKTKAGIRVLPIFPELRNIFLTLRKNRACIDKNNLVEIDGIKDFVFTTKSGRPFMPNGINNFLKHIREAYNDEEMEKEDGILIKDLSAYTFRYTACTRMIELEVPPKVIQKYLGHSTEGITMAVYNKAKSYEHIKKELPKLDEHYSKYRFRK